MRDHSGPARRPHRAAVLVDYDNLYHLLAERIDPSRYADDLISELIDELRRHLAGEKHTHPAVAHAFGDFSVFDGDGPYIQRALGLQEVEPHFVPSDLQANAAEVRLCVEAMELLHQRPDVDTFVILTGDRAYLPLVQVLRQYGRRAYVAAVDPPALPKTLTFTADDVFLDVLDLLTADSYRELSARSGAEHRAGEPAEAETTTPPPFTVVDEPFARLALRIIEEHFGQYEEVYLTPLLRKLSELIDERQHDPKELVSGLEACGAVRLEKRRGFPHDYTVLIVDPRHPDVQSVRRELAGSLLPVHGPGAAVPSGSRADGPADASAGRDRAAAH